MGKRPAANRCDTFFASDAYTNCRDQSKEQRAMPLRFHRSQPYWTAIMCAVLCVSAGAQEATIPPVAQPGDGALRSAGFIYELEGRPTPECHASTIVETDEGLLV